MGKLPSIHVSLKYWKSFLSLEKDGVFPFNPLQATKARAITELTELLKVPPFPVQDQTHVVGFMTLVWEQKVRKRKLLVVLEGMGHKHLVEKTWADLKCPIHGKCWYFSSDGQVTTSRKHEDTIPGTQYELLSIQSLGPFPVKSQVISRSRERR